MGQEHYVSVTLADLIRQSQWVLVAEYLGSEKRTKPCKKQEYAYGVGKLKVRLEIKPAAGIVQTESLSAFLPKVLK
jgi:hypothetical protein